ncbi:hypothetical protein [Anthocerotibacter panamensis]|uniref:hypothetical protein n=1 Tax=Anthocerotibacter panamensis TaxID=2857077 RepID=UPI001C401A3B|nr:hypothetical protein [Anthocerotibacter panamensis]
MSKQLINLTLPLVKREIDKVLQTYPQRPAQGAFANPDMRQELIAFVLSHIPNTFVAVETDNPERADSHACAAENQYALHATIREGVERLLVLNSDWIEHCVPGEVCSPPTSWFG